MQNKIIFLVVLLHIGFLSSCVSTNSKKVVPEEVAAANINLAAEYFSLGRMEQALNAAKKAIKADPQSVNANAMLGLIYQRLEQARQADEYFSTAVELVDEDSADFGIIHNNYGVFLCQQNHLLDAEEHFLLAANNKLYRSPQSAFENAGVCALKANRSKAAEKYFRAALKITPNLPRSLIEMAKIQFKKANYLSARGYLQRYHEVTNGDAKSLFLAIKVERLLGAENEVLRLKNELLKRFPDSREAKMLTEP